MVSSSFTDERVAIIKGDAFTYDTTEFYDAVWHGIWNSKTDVNLTEKETLQDKYKDRCNWQGFLFSGHGGVRPGSGRKKGTIVKKQKLKPIDQQKTIRKGVRYTPVEYTLIERACALSGKSETEIMFSGSIEKAKKIIEDHSKIA